jgi:hypothetical protein
LLPNVFRPLVTTPVVSMTAGLTKHFILHTSWNVYTRILIFSLPLYYIPVRGYCYSSSRQLISSILFLISSSALFARTSLSVCTPWFHSTVISCSHADFRTFEHQLSVVSMPNFLHIEYCRRVQEIKT